MAIPAPESVLVIDIKQSNESKKDFVERVQEQLPAKEGRVFLNLCPPCNKPVFATAPDCLVGGDSRSQIGEGLWWHLHCHERQYR